MSKPLFSIENNNDYIRRNFTDKQYRPVDENEYQSDNVVESLMNDAFLYPDHIENLVKMTGEKWDTFTEEQRKSMDISQKTIRLSVGLESAHDLYNDIKQALAR